MAGLLTINVSSRLGKKHLATLPTAEVKRFVFDELYKNLHFI